MSKAVGFVFRLVPGTTPKKPDSGLTAQRRPSGPGRIQAMSSPTVHAFHPGIDFGGTIIARFVLPHAEGNAPPMYRVCPDGSSRPRISMCSAIHSSFLPSTLARRSAMHFLPSRALPPYPDPMDQTVLSSRKCMMNRQVRAQIAERMEAPREVVRLSEVIERDLADAVS